MKNVRCSLHSLGFFNKQNHIQQLVIGSTAGFATGYLTMKVGRKVAIVVGTGIIIFQVAQNHGFTKFNWGDACVKAKSITKSLEDRTGDLKQKAKNYAATNNCFAASFVGGFLIGAACKC